MALRTAGSVTFRCSHCGARTKAGADDGIRTRDPHLGKVGKAHPATCAYAAKRRLTCGLSYPQNPDVSRRYPVRRGTDAGHPTCFHDRSQPSKSRSNFASGELGNGSFTMRKALGPLTMPSDASEGPGASTPGLEPVGRRGQSLALRSPRAKSGPSSGFGFVRSPRAKSGPSSGFGFVRSPRAKSPPPGRFFLVIL
jgi:hypothetical protein